MKDPRAQHYIQGLLERLGGTGGRRRALDRLAQASGIPVGTLRNYQHGTSVPSPTRFQRIWGAALELGALEAHAIDGGATRVAIGHVPEMLAAHRDLYHSTKRAPLKGWQPLGLRFWESAIVPSAIWSTSAPRDARRWPQAIGTFGGEEWARTVLVYPRALADAYEFALLDLRECGPQRRLINGQFIVATLKGPDTTPRLFRQLSFSPRDGDDRGLQLTPAWAWPTLPTEPHEEIEPREVTFGDLAALLYHGNLRATRSA